MKCKQIIVILIFIILITNIVTAGDVSDTWGSIKKYIAVNPGTSKEAWSTSTNSIITNGETEMVSVGDGTYQIQLNLTPGATYNYMFFAKTDSTPPSGLQPYTTYWDCMPNGGNIACGTDPTTPQSWDTDSLPPSYYSSVGENNSNARRVLTLPSDLTQSDTFYVFNNFSGKPGTVTNLKAEAVNTTSVLVSWDAPYGYWGTDQEEKKACDVIAGGTYAVLRYTNDDTSTYVVIAELPGNTYSFLDTGLTQGWWYWYVVVCYDAYLGSPGTAFEQGVSEWSDADTGVPNPPVKVILKVEGMNLEYIREHENEIWLTPLSNLKNFYAKRWKGKLVYIKL